MADDGSDPALRAVSVAAELAARTGAELIALAIVDPAEFRRTDVTAFAHSEHLDEAGAIEGLLDTAAEYLERCRMIANQAGVASFHLEKRAASDVASEILDVARDRRADLIVVGSRGRSRLPGLLLGSVSQKLASLAPCSVLIAR